MRELEGPARTVSTSTGLFYIEASDVTGNRLEGISLSTIIMSSLLSITSLSVCSWNVPEIVLLGLRGFGARIFLNGLASFIHSNTHM